MLILVSPYATGRMQVECLFYFTQIFHAAKRSVVPIYKGLNCRKYLIARDSRKELVFPVATRNSTSLIDCTTHWMYPTLPRYPNKVYLRKISNNAAHPSYCINDSCFTTIGRNPDSLRHVSEERSSFAQHRSKETNASEPLPTRHLTSYFSRRPRRLVGGYLDRGNSQRMSNSPDRRPFDVSLFRLFSPKAEKSIGLGVPLFSWWKIMQKR